MKPIKMSENLRKAAGEVLGPAESVEVPAAMSEVLGAAGATGDKSASPAALAGLCSMMTEAEHNAHAYKAAASALKAAGHRECSKYFKYMGDKWCGVAKKAGSFIEDLGGVIQFGAIAPVEAMPGDPAALAQKFFALEKAMSEKMYSFMHASEESDPPVHEYLGHVVDKRVKMEKCSREFLRLVQLAGDDWMGLDHSVKHWLRG